MSRILLYTDQQNIQERVTKTCIDYQKNVITMTNHDHLLQVIDQSPDHERILLITDGNSLIQMNTETLKKLENHEGCSVTVINTKDITKKILFFLTSKLINNVVSFNSNDFENELTRSINIFEFKISGETQKKYFYENIKLENIKKFELINSQKRWDIYKDIENYIATLDSFSGFSQVVVTIVSELITNAFYDAPRSEITGEALNPSRKTTVNLAPPMYINFTCGVENEYLWLIVTDPFGTLNRGTLLQALNRAITEKTAIIDGEGGAGLGLYMIMDAASEAIFCLQNKNQTTVACKLKVTKRFKAFSLENSSMHIIT
jgi:sigma-B regulation protein RsbU (phosphoserine phosphatase)